MKYSSPNSMIQLSLKCSLESTRFEVKDSGIGITPEDQHHIYQPFYRGHNASEVKGTGLGLAVVKKCVDLHQGTIALHSEVEVGTTFTIEFPRH